MTFVEDYCSFKRSPRIRYDLSNGKTKDQCSKGMEMIVEEIVGFILSLVPYLNVGTLTLIINLGFERFGLKITKREFKKEPLKSLFWGLCLIFNSSFVAIIIQTRLSGFEPFLALIILFIIYMAVNQV